MLLKMKLLCILLDNLINMNLQLEDWKAFCEGEKDFDKSHFHTLLMKNEYHEDISKEEYNNVFKYFPNSTELIIRLQNYYSNKNYLHEIIDVKEYLLSNTMADINEKSILFYESDIKEFLKGDINYVDDIKEVSEAKLKGCLNEEYIDIIDDHIFDSLYVKNSRVNALLEAFFGLTRNYQLVWYLASPLIDSEINFDHYFNIWKVGGEYAITEKGIIVSRKI